MKINMPLEIPVKTAVGIQITGLNKHQALEEIAKSHSKTVDKLFPMTINLKHDNGITGSVVFKSAEEFPETDLPCNTASEGVKTWFVRYQEK